MFAVTPDMPALGADEPFTSLDDAPHTRHLGVVPTASMLTGAAIGVVWFWIPLTILIVGISSIPRSSVSCWRRSSSCT